MYYKRSSPFLRNKIPLYALVYNHHFLPCNVPFERTIPQHLKQRFHFYDMQGQVKIQETFARNIPNRVNVYNELSIINTSNSLEISYGISFFKNLSVPNSKHFVLSDFRNV